MSNTRKSCVIPSCKHKDRKDVEKLSYHGFPSLKLNPLLRRQWVEIIRELNKEPEWEPGSYDKVCSLHFPGKNDKGVRLDANAVPALRLTPVLDADLVTEKAGSLNDKTEVEDVGRTLEPTNTVKIVCPTCSDVIDIHISPDGRVELDAKRQQPSHDRIKSRKRLFDEMLDDSEEIDSETNYNPNSSLVSTVSSIEVTPKSRKKVRAEHSYNASPGAAADELKKVKKELTELKKQHYNLHKKLERRDKAQTTIKDKLLQQKLLNSHQINNLSDRFPKLLRSIVDTEHTALTIRGKTGIVYDEEMKKFSASLHFYSPKAYNFLREYLTLPHPHTISSWMKSSDCGPGFNTEVMARMAEVRRLDDTNIITDIVVMIDEMAIRKELVWNPSKHWYEGHIDYGTEDLETDNELPLASDVLVCMIAGLSGGWKLPIGYIFTDKTDSDVQKAFVDKAFVLLEEAGFNVHALISDGNTANVALFDAYGVIENPSQNGDIILYSDIKTVFPNPANPEKHVHAIYDVCHMLKLWRNLLAQCGEITMEDGRTVNWQYIVRLFKLQDKEKIRAANRLGRTHIEFQNHKMKVRLAAQSISKSIADAIVFCTEKLNLPEFQGSEGTSYFVHLLNKVFDILNSMNPAQKCHKAPFNRKNINYQRAILETFCSIALSMSYVEVRKYKATKTKEERVVRTVKNLAQSARKRAAIGLVVSIKSILAVTMHILYRAINPMRYVMTYRFSQDHLELFFNKIRSRLGCNNNPNTLELKYAMKAVWHQHLMTSKNNGNCVAQMSEKSIPMGLLPLKRTPTPKVEPLELKDIGDLESIDLSWFEDPNYSPFYRNCLAYISGNVVRIVGTRLTCELCAEGLLNTEVDELRAEFRQLIMVKDRGGLFTPCQSVFIIVEMADTVFRMLVRESGGSMKIADLDRKIFKLVLLKCIERPIFPHMQAHFVDFDPLASESHLYTLIKDIVLHFLKIRLFDYGKRFQKEKQISTRHTLNKITLFRGQ